MTQEIRPAPRSDPQSYLVPCLLGLALLVRLVYVLWIVPNEPFADSPDYLDGARRLLQGRSMVVRISALMIRPPGYSVFIALCWALTRCTSPVVIKIAQALASAGACFYVYRLARLLAPRAALLSLAGAALYPHFIYYTAVICSETVFCLLFTAAAYYLCRALGSSTPSAATPPAWAPLLGSGVLFSLANLVRVNLSVHLLLILLWLLLLLRRRPALALRAALVFGLPVLLLPLPWCASVYRQGQGLMWISDGAGFNTMLGHGDDPLHFYCGPPGSSDGVSVSRAMRRPEFLAARALPPAEQSAALLRAARRWDRAHLGDLPCLMLGKAIHLWRPWMNPKVFSARTVLASLLAAPLFLLGGLGAAWALKDGERRLAPLVGICAIASTLCAVLVAVNVRYRVPIIDPLLLSCCGYPLARLRAGALKVPGSADPDDAKSARAVQQVVTAASDHASIVGPGPDSR